MSGRFRWIAAALLLAPNVPPARAEPAEGPAAARSIRGILVEPGRATPEWMASWKAEGGTAVVVLLDESLDRGRWAEIATAADRSGLALYPWVEVARNPAMADAHPGWMAAIGGHHDDWRRRFPAAPAARRGQVIKAWPWVPIGHAPAFDAHRDRVEALLKDLPEPWAGIFLNDLQAGPSSCGCGNDQCRWALDYGSPATAPRTPGEDVAARFVTAIRAANPGREVIPVWVTECEMVDLPGVAGSTGHCGGVECARNDCWPRYDRALSPVLKAIPGPIGVALWRQPFGRDPGWPGSALGLFAHPPRGATGVPPGRTVAVLQGWGLPEPGRAAMLDRLGDAGAGWVVALAKVDQSWEPRPVAAPE